MLKITNTVLQDISSQRQESYIDKLLPFIRGKAPSLFENLPDADARMRIRAAIESAKTIGCLSDAGLMKYAALCMLCGLDFLRSPEILAFFNEPGRSFDVKIEWLITKVTDQLSHIASAQEYPGP